jgi:hypothetical protein
VLGAAWKGSTASRDTITDPDGNATSVQQLAGYFYVMQFAAALAARDPKIHREWYELLRSAG